MINITILGGVGEYGRNCFLLEHKETNTCIMIDCGVKNGIPEQFPPITKEIAQSVQAVFISHVHNDHIGALPLLAEKGFKGEIWMSESSLEQMTTIMENWQQKAFPFPFSKTVLKQLKLRSFAKETRGKCTRIIKNLSITWGYSGHMLGSVWYIFHLGKETVFYSGDIVMNSCLLETDSPKTRSFDIALIDSGHSAQSMPYKNSIENITTIIQQASEKYLIPITISGKACDLLFALYNELPDQKLFIDEALFHHLQLYLLYADNMRKEKKHTLNKILQSDRLQIFSTEINKEPGIYFLLSKPSGFKKINTNIYMGEYSSFYKSHPDLNDLVTLLSSIQSKKYLFFHSSQEDLKKIMMQLHSYPYLKGSVKMIL